jgi:hypothetical protein
MRREGIQRPIGIGHNMNPAILTDEKGHLRASLTSGSRGFGGIEDGLGSFGEAGHEILIAKISCVFLSVCEISGLPAAGFTV